MLDSPDMSRFTSRVRYRGQLRFESAHRIGASQSLAADTTKLPILRTADGRPYIPGSSFKGAWRSYTEAILRTVQEQSGMIDNLSCLSLSMPLERPSADFDNGRCLTIREVSSLKENYKASTEGDPLSQLDAELRRRTCLVCGLFGNQWLTSKVFIKDLMLPEEVIVRTEIRDGVGIDRDAARAAHGYKYDFETVPAGVAFEVDILIENASEVELGAAMLGLEAFKRGEVLLGGAKSRGLGWCKLDPVWEQSEYVTEAQLLDTLLGGEPPELTAAQVNQWLTTFAQAIRQEDAHA